MERGSSRESDQFEDIEERHVVRGRFNAKAQRRKVARPGP
jgi:hypothetical protein